MLNDFIKERIAYEIIKVINRKFNDFPDLSNVDSIRNAPFHESFLNAFTEQFNSESFSVNKIISLSSWQHGFNTSLGNFFEKIAHILSNGEKSKFSNLKVTPNQNEQVSTIIARLKSEGNPNLELEESAIFNLQGNATIACPEFTADIFTQGLTDIEMIELKTVRPNSGEMKGEKQKILYGKAALRKRHPNKNISYYLGFPFDPTSDTETGYDKTRFKNYLIETKKFFADEEILIARELWNHLAGSEDSEDTMSDILLIVNDISTPLFLDNMAYISEFSNFLNDPSNYKEILNNWHLIRELSVFERVEADRSLLENTSFMRQVHRKRFVKDSVYNLDRLDSLLNYFN